MRDNSQVKAHNYLNKKIFFFYFLTYHYITKNNSPLPVCCLLIIIFNKIKNTLILFLQYILLCVYYLHSILFHACLTHTFLEKFNYLTIAHLTHLA